MKKLSSKFFLGILICAGITFSFFLPNLLSGKIPIPSDDLLGLYHPWRDQAYGGYVQGHFPVKNPLITDPVLQTYPWRYLVIKNIFSFNFPLWNPYSFSGQPLVANVQSAAFQIFNVLFILLPFKVAWAAQVILPLMLNTIFMYLFLANLKNKNKLLSKKAAVFGSIVLSFSGFYVAWLEWGTIITTAIWLPLILLSLDKLKLNIKPWWFLILTFALFQTTVSGHTQTGYYIFLATIIYFIFNLYKNFNKKYFFLVILSLFLSFLIAAPQVIPSLEFMNLSSRGIDQGYYPNRQDWFLPLQNLVQIAVPDFFGNPTTFNYWGIWNYWEFVSYLGIVPLFLVLLAIFKKPREKVYFISLLILSLIFSTENIISKIPYVYNFPIISSFQPSRIIFLMDFSLAVLAAFGFDYLVANRKKIKNVIIPLLILASLVFLFFLAKTQKQLFPQTTDLNGAYIAVRNLYLPLLISTSLVLLVISSRILKSQLLILVIFLLTIIDLFRFSYKFTSFSKITWTYPSTKTLDFIQSQARPFRVITTDRRILHPNTSGVYGIESVDGYDPLYLKEYAKFVTSWQSNSANSKISSFNRIVTPQKLDSNIINLLNVKYILTFDTLANPNFNHVFTEGETKIYENKNFLPRVFFVSDVIKTQNRQEDLANILKSADFSTAFSKDISISSPNNKSSVEITKYTDQSISLQTNSQKEAPLLITNVNYPGWQAYIDNQKTKIYQADYLFQLILVPQGTHQITFVYKPQYLYPALYLSLFGVGLTILVSLLIWRRKFL